MRTPILTDTNVPRYAFQQRDRTAWRVLAIVCVCVFALPLAFGSFATYVGCTIACYAIAALGLQLMVGVAGQLSLGHAAFMAIGAYATVLSQTRLSLPFFAAVLVGMLAAALAGLLMAQLIRLSGVYFKIATFGFGIIVYQIISNGSSLTGGHTGLTDIPPIELGAMTVTSRTGLFITIAVALCISYVLCLRMVQGRAGRALLAVGQNEPAAEASGVNVAGYKMTVIVVGCALAGLGGAFVPQLDGFLNVDSFTWTESLLLLMMIVIGGTGSLPGAIAGTAVLILVPEVLRDLADQKMLLFGVLLVLSLIFMPKGLAGVVEAIFVRLGERKART